MISRKQFFQTRQHMLNKEFEVFNYEDYSLDSIDFHQHDFFEIYLFLSGNVTYIIEGRQYKLVPDDLLIISAGSLHKPIIESPEDRYERIVLWISNDYLEKLCTENTDLRICFDKTAKNHRSLLRALPEVSLIIKHLMKQILLSYQNHDFGWDILCRSLIQQLLVYTRRIFMQDFSNVEESITENPLVNDAIKYINSNITKKLSLDIVAEKCFCSKYYLAHEFKKYTKTSLYRYITQKRLVLSKQLIYEGHPITHVYQSCGFNDYSNFFRAFKNEYGITPKQYFELMKGEFPVV